VVIPSKGKVSLITDDDGDDVADTERIIAEGWPEGRQAVDGVAVAFDPEDHAIYFGMGTALYNNTFASTERLNQWRYRSCRLGCSALSMRILSTCLSF
jgi:hypothetical protein